MTEHTIADFTVGDNVSAFHPRMFGVVCTGKVIVVGRKWLHVDFGVIRGGIYRVHPSHVTEIKAPT